MESRHANVDLLTLFFGILTLEIVFSFLVSFRLVATRTIQNNDKFYVRLAADF